VPAVAMADVMAALVATETAMLQRRRRPHKMPKLIYNN